VIHDSSSRPTKKKDELNPRLPHHGSISGKLNGYSVAVRRWQVSASSGSGSDSNQRQGQHPAAAAATGTASITETGAPSADRPPGRVNGVNP
jgi:hypothetical protein